MLVDHDIDVYVMELAGETRIVLISNEGDFAIKDDLVESEDKGTSGEEEISKGSS